MIEAFNEFNNTNIVSIFKNTTEDENTTEIFNDKLLRAKKLSEIFVGTSQATYNKWFNAGLLPRYRILGSIFYKQSEVEALIENSRESRKEV